MSGGSRTLVFALAQEDIAPDDIWSAVAAGWTRAIAVALTRRRSSRFATSHERDERQLSAPAAASVSQDWSR